MFIIGEMIWNLVKNDVNFGFMEFGDKIFEILWCVKVVGWGV